MNRSDLTSAIADRSGLTVAEADAALRALVESIAETLAGGDSVTVAGFGTFERRTRAARTGRNPRTGESIDIPASQAPAFKPAAAFKRGVAAT